MSPLRVMKKGVPTACTSAVGKPVTYDGGFLSLSPKSQHKPTSDQPFTRQIKSEAVCYNFV